MLSDLIEKEKDYRNNESTFEKESNVESSSDREEEGEEIASVNASKDEDTQGSDNDTENDSEETESSNPETSTTFHSKIQQVESTLVVFAVLFHLPEILYWS